MADSTSSLATSESILIDGANGVTSAPRAHFPDAVVGLVIAIVVAGTVRFVRRPIVVAMILAIGAVPGLVHVLALRADAPLRRGAMTDSIKVTLGDLQTRVPWPQSQVTVIREEDDALFPLGRYALPSRTGGPLELVIGTGPLGQVCRQEDHRVTCGGSP